jgi:hypothetical protein
MDDQTFEQAFIYTSPFYDQIKTLKVRISDGEIHSDYEHQVFVYAIDSALNENKLYISAPVSYNNVPRDEYISTEMIFLTNKNGIEVIEHMDMDVELRGRGNSTWFMPKKPFRIRFKEDTSVLGMPSARNYVLLAEYSDKSLIRNTVVHKFSSLLDNIEHTIQTRVIELYFNDIYQGVYILTEHVESHENKLYIDVNYDVLDSGYLIEQDQRMFESNIPEGFYWFNLTGRAYDIVRPNTSHLKYTQAHTIYIQNYFYELQQALILQQGYEDYLDIDNFIDYFITQELFKNVDVGWSSVYMYKRQGEVLRMGPLWDFDLAIGNADYIDYGVENFYGFAENKNYWFHLMMKIPEVRQKFRERFTDIYFDIIPEILTMIDVIEAAKTPAALRNFERWQILDTYVWPNTDEMLSTNTYQGQIDYVRSYIEQRALWMLNAVNSQAFLDGEYN